MRYIINLIFSIVVVISLGVVTAFLVELNDIKGERKKRK